MRFVCDYALLPFRKTYDAYVDESADREVITMDYIQGNILRDAWDNPTSEQQSSILGQPELYGQADSPPCYDHLFCVGEESFGPYGTESEFNEGPKYQSHEARTRQPLGWTTSPALYEFCQLTILFSRTVT
ncbi:hypothetical protein PAAG_07048 [Paracoccidioides lutzii Pb01]|uniref:Uncharacterized protein n=1 Tax=Paracoccidioides lutzii (strain ATCC MYA-826 / Pb01) TaxID=502779 RepID=C1H871_PARBA|nr:hypothetical protein PAAG_07048 [Paracoccidioides lutzii Pb01]EEH36630.2 hypothetical protein PAAG_07048 [Paracoccidioides lutzii Pb01]